MSSLFIRKLFNMFNVRAILIVMYFAVNQMRNKLVFAKQFLIFCFISFNIDNLLTTYLLDIYVIYYMIMNYMIYIVYYTVKIIFFIF